MNTILVVLLTAIFFQFPAFADQVQDERRYYQVQEQLVHLRQVTIGRADKILVDAIEDVYEADPTWPVKAHILRTVRAIALDGLELSDQIRLVVLEKSIRGFSPNEKQVVNKIKNTGAGLDKRTRYTLLQSGSKLEGLPPIQSESYARHPDLELLSKGPVYSELTPTQIQDLYFKTPDLEKYKYGAYKNVPRLFMFCSHVRTYACLMLMKDHEDRPVYLPDGKTLWSQPSLGYARSGKPFFQRNGYTPSGVYEINSVMPAADQQTSFGKYRRLILDFIPKSANESRHTFLLPPSHWDEKWWRDATLARDVGRNLLRIHGTGKKNTDPQSTFKPFVATAGCIAQREAKYEGTTYIDQRHILDQLMMASGLEPNFKNEVKIRALLYVVEIKNEKGAVDLRLLNDLGLK